MATPSEAIIAVATGWGPSDRAVIRISGPGTHALCARLMNQIPSAGGEVISTRLRLTSALQLPCVLLRYDAPSSYTGEDSAEILLPGNPLLLERVSARLLSEPGLREAQPGEFSARAYLNGKMTIAQAEGVAALIAAGTEDQLAAAHALMSGRTGERHRAWTDAAATLLALVEAGIDFTDQEDVVPIAPALLAARLDALINEIHADLGANAGIERQAGLARVALIGPPNAGKSTLFNALLGRARAMVSPVAGTTRDAIVETLDLSRDLPGGPSVQLVDLAGLDSSIGAASGAVDRQAQSQAMRELERADVLVLCDPLGRFTFDAWVPFGRPIVRVRTKADLPLLDTSEAAGRSGWRVSRQSIGVCSLDGWNLDVLRRAIADAAWSTRDTGGAWMLPRHRRALASALARLIAARQRLDPAAHALSHPELVAGELRAALDDFGELVGAISSDDVIGRVFATFCVGK